MKKTLIKNGTLVSAKELRACDILIDVKGEIEQIGEKIQTKHDANMIDAEKKLIMPLLIDCHVHFREPGFPEKATMKTEAAAALAGGVGTVCEMPNTVPPTVTIAALADKVRRAADTDGCDLRFFFGVTEAAHLLALRELWTGTSLELKRLKKHCCGVKLYLDHSTGNQKVQADIIGDIFRTCAELKIPIIAHCEDPDMNAQALAKNTRTDIAAHSEIRSPESEAASIKAAIEHMRTSGAALHIAHLSTAQGLELVRAAKKEKLPVTCEVAPHHLFLTVDDYSWLGTLGKMNPPLRTMEHRDALWAGIADKTVDCIATDHAPHTLAEKRTDEPLTAPSGVPGVETMLPLLLTVAAGKWPAKSKKPAGATLAYTDIIRLCFMRPNEIFSLHAADIKVKGRARMIIVNPSQEWTLKNSDLKTKCGWSPFDGWTVQGCVDRIVQ